VNVEPSAEASRGPEDWFTGEVWIEPIGASHGATSMNVSSVRFTPGARTAWHTHGGGQTLHVTEGEGRAQARGEPVHTIRPGDTVHINADEWHWHGASPDQGMTHLSLAEGDANWGEHVTDAEYTGD
jgi:quercetin dioxygenase-like cupin family protein